MKVTRIALIITAVGSIIYTVGLLVVPDLLGELGAGPEQTSWVRYLIPIYIGLGVMAWVASVDPRQFSQIAWAFTLIWAGLAAAHVVNMSLGDEPVSVSTVGLLAFDAAMAVILVIGLLQLRRSARTPPARSS